MYNNSRIFAFIPARGGSKGIKNKNIVSLNGLPLLSYSIQAALESQYVDNVIVSTDSMKIATIAKEYGANVPFIRPASLADDSSRTVDAVIHAISFLKTHDDYYDVLLLLQPTQPLRTAGDIDGAIELFFERGMRGLVSVSLVEDHPVLIRTLSEDGLLTSLLHGSSTIRRQDMSAYYRVNGCIYLNRVDEITEKTSFNDNPVGYVMERSHSVDIDEMKDLYVAEYYLNERNFIEGERR